MNDRRPNTPPLAFLGSGALIASLFAPWYALRLPPDLVNSITNQLAPQMGAFGGLLRQGAAALNNYGPIDLTAFDVFKQLHIVLMMLGVVAMLLSVLAYTGRAGYVGHMVTLAGLVAVGLVTYRILKPPGPGFISDTLLHVRWGAYAGLAGALATTVGGIMITREERRPAARLPSAPASWTPVAPGLADAIPPSRATPPSWW